MTKVITTLGVTGNQGGSVARTFLKIPGWRVRGITRNPASPSASKLKEAGIELVVANLDDTASLERAFEGSDAIYAVTDFWQFFQEPATQELAKSKGITLNEACFNREVQQGKNIIDAAAKATASGRLERMVLSSLSDTKKISKGKYTWNYHFDSKGKFIEYLEDMAKKNDDYQALFEKTSYVQIGFYLDNWKMNPVFTPQKQPDGSFVIRSPSAAPHHPVPFVNPPKDTGPFVEALVLKAPPQATMLGTCRLMPFAEYAETWGSILGVKCKWEPLTVEATDKMIPGGLGREVGESGAFVAEFGWDGGIGAKLPEQLGVKMDELTKVEEYIRDTDWSSVLN